MALLLMSLPAAAAGASALPAGHAHAGHSEAWQGAAVGGFHADEGRDGHGSLSVYGRSPVAVPTLSVRSAPADVPLPGDIDAVPADTINGRPVYHSVFYKLHPQQIWRGEEGELTPSYIYWPQKSVIPLGNKACLPSLDASWRRERAIFSIIETHLVMV